MSDTSIPGYRHGDATLDAPIPLTDLERMKKTALFGEEDERASAGEHINCFKGTPLEKQRERWHSNDHQAEGGRNRNEVYHPKRVT